MAKRKVKAAKRENATAKVPPKPRSNTKQQRLIEMLRRPQGATVAQLAKALSWQPHTVRGTISGVLKKRLGLTIASKKGEAGRFYRIGGAGSSAST